MNSNHIAKCRRLMGNTFVAVVLGCGSFMMFSQAALAATSDTSIALVGTYTPYQKPAKNNGPVVWDITVTNSGPYAAANTTVQSMVTSTDVSVLFQSAVASQGGCAISLNTLSCNLGTLESGAVATVRLESNTAGTTFKTYNVTNSSSVSSDSIDPNSNNNSASLTVRTN